MKMPVARILLLLAPFVPLAQARAATEAEVKALIQNYCDSWRTGNEALFLSAIDDQFHFSNPGGTFDRKQTLVQFRESPKLYANIRFYNLVTVIQGDRFVAEYQYCSTDKATGKREADGTVAVGEVRNGKLISWKEYYDPSVGDLQAAGKLVVDEGGAPYPFPHSAPNRW
jgi:hypothetical protein